MVLLSRLTCSWNLAKAVADRLAEAFAELIHAKIRGSE